MSEINTCIKYWRSNSEENVLFQLSCSCDIVKTVSIKLKYEATILTQCSITGNVPLPYSDRLTDR